MTINEDLNYNILGNQEKIKYFLKVLNKSQGGNVWLIQGPKGIGKSTLIINYSSHRLKLNNLRGKDIIDPDFFLINQKDKKKNLYL